MGYTMNDPNGVIALPQIMTAMQNDPRVAAMSGLMANAGSTSPIYGSGFGPGLSRILEGVVGGMGTRRNEQRYGAFQHNYMDEVRSAIAGALGGQNGNSGEAPIGGGLPANPSGGTPLSIPPDAQALLNTNPNFGAPPGGNSQGGAQMQPSPAPSGVMPMQPSPAPSGVMPLNGGGPPGIATPGGGGTGAPIQGSPAPIPGMPQPPNIPPPLQSTRLKLGQALMGGSNPLSFMEGLQDVNAGLEEKAQNEALAQSRQFALSNTQYGAALGDYYDANQQARGNTYQSGRDARLNQFDIDKNRQNFEYQWALQSQQQGFDASQKNKDRMLQMYDLYGKTYGQLPTDLSGLDSPDTQSKLLPDAVWNLGIKPQESGGEASPGTARNPSSGALGSTQMMPQTAQDMATKLGLPFKPELLQSNTPEALEYQNMLGRAYFNEGLEKYNGNIPKAVAYYYGGPDEKQWGPKTMGYVNSVLGRVNGAASSSGSSVSSIFAPPKATGSTVFGIDLNANPNKPMPQYESKTLTEGANNLNELLQLRQAFKDGFSGLSPAGRALNSVESVTGLGGQDAQDRIDWWKRYDALANGLRHGLFGARLTPFEVQQFNSTSISPSTSVAVARKRLDSMYGTMVAAMKREARKSATSFSGKEVYESLGGNDFTDALNHDTPLSTQRQAQAVSDKGIPRGFSVSLGTPPARSQPQAVSPPQRRRFVPPNGSSFITDPSHFRLNPFGNQ